MMVLALCVIVLITPILCSIGWWLSNCRYWSVWVCCLYTLNLSEPSVFLVMSVSSITRVQLLSSSLVHLMFLCWLLRWEVKDSMADILMMATPSSTYLPQNRRGSLYESRVFTSNHSINRLHTIGLTGDVVSYLQGMAQLPVMWPVTKILLPVCECPFLKGRDIDVTLVVFFQ